MNTTPVWDLGLSAVKDVLVLYIYDGSYFEADDLKDTFVRHCVISITAGLFFFDPKFCSRTNCEICCTGKGDLEHLGLIADDLKDAFVRHCVISTTAGLFSFLTPSFVLGCRELLRLQRPRQAHGAHDHHGTRCAGQWQLGKIMQAVSVLHTTRKLLVSVF